MNIPQEGAQMNRSPAFRVPGLLWLVGYWKLGRKDSLLGGSLAKGGIAKSHGDVDDNNGDVVYKKMIHIIQKRHLNELDTPISHDISGRKTLWVCLKMVSTPTPNGFADHYPY